MRVTILTDSPFITTGYRDQAIKIAKYLISKGHEVHWLANGHTGKTLDFIRLEDGTELNCKIYGQKAPYFQDILSHHLKKTKSDILLIILDTFMLHGDPNNPSNGWFLKIDHSPAKAIFWYPSDGGAGMPTGCDLILKKCEMAVAYSKFAQKQVKDYYGMDTPYIPLGTEPERFYKLPEVDREKLKERWGLKDKFVIGSVFRNQPRKFPDRMIKTMYAFKKIAEKVPNAIMLLHTDPNDPARPTNLFNLIKRFNLENKVIFTGMNAMNSFDWNKMNDVYNLMDVFFLSTCYTPETLVQTINGIKKIKDIKEEDLVLTHDGTYQKVNKLFKYKYKGNIRKIKPTYSKEFKCTPNHRFLVLKNDKPKDSYRKKKLKNNPKLEWVPAEFIRKGDYLVYPRNKIIKDMNYTEEQMRLFGYYIAEGCIKQKRNKEQGIAFSINTKEEDLTKDILYLMKKYYKINGKVYDYDRNRRVIEFYSVKVGKQFKNMFKSGAKNKDMPTEFMFLPFTKQEQLIKGLWLGDGCFYYNKNKNATEIEYQTVSEKLGWRIFNLLIRLGYIPSFKEQKRQSMVYSIKMADRQKWKFAKIFNYKLKEKNIGNQIGWVDENYAYMPVISNIKEEYEGFIYDLNVDVNHTYVTSIAGHNSGEGWGIPFVEAMSAEVPVVATDYTTTQEIVKDHNAGFGAKLVGTKELNMFEMDMKQYDLEVSNGTLTGSWEVERGFCDVEDAAEKIYKLAQDPELRKEMGRNGRKAVLEEYDQKIVNEKWLKLMQSLI